MNFCDSCGILLPAPSTEKIPYCKPCKLQADHRPGQTQCDCELCHRGSSIATVSTISHQTSSSQMHHPQKSKREKQIPVHGVQNRTKKTFQENEDVGDSKSDFTSRSRSSPCPVQREDSKENQVAEEIRSRWEREQTEMKKKLIKEDIPEILALISGKRRKPDGGRYYIGGVDISFYKGSNVDACACLTVLQMPDLKMVYQRMEKIELQQPYIPGFLAFREVPALVNLYERLKEKAPCYLPDVIMVDGNGILHPRGFGFACQLGVILDVPTMGVAKTLISAQGIVDDEVHKQKKHAVSEAGDGFDLVSDSGDVLGMCLRAHDKAPNPIYISVGHKITLNSAKWLALECSKYRIPEPVRRADLDSREYIRQDFTSPKEHIVSSEGCSIESDDCCDVGFQDDTVTESW